MKTEWIKMTDRRPTEADLPVWAWFAYDKECRGPYLFDEQLCMDDVTHWRPAKDDIPEPPKPEPTQRERDQGEFNAWWDPLRNVPHCADAWHAALAWERGEVAKMLPKVISQDPAATVYHKPAWECVEQIRARCGGGGK